MQDLRQSQEYTRYMEKIGWRVEEGKIFIRMIPLLGSIIKIQRPEKIDFSRINHLAKKYRTLFIKIEPLNRKDAEEAKTQNFKENNSPLLCSKTIQVDLTPSEEKIMAQMKKDARYEIRKSQKQPLSLIELDDLSLFRKTWRKLAKRERWVPPNSYLTALKEAFGNNAIFLVVRNTETDQILGGVTVLLSNQTAYYYFAFSSNAGKKLGVPYFLVWETMKMAKKNGCKTFDFEGIYDERFPIKSWKGFTHFKKSFGGEEVEFPGPVIKVYNPILRLFSSKL